VHFAYWLAVLSPTIVVLFPALAAWRARSRELLALFLWFGTITFVYTFYEVSRDTWWCLRFILPAFPPLVIASLIGVQTWLTRPRTRAIAAAALVVWAVACTVYWKPRLHFMLMKSYEQVYEDACLKANEVLPLNALVVSFYTSGAIYYYTEFPVLRWDLIESKDFFRYATLARETRRPICAMVFDELEDEAFKERVPGEWQRLTSVGRIGLWQLVTPHAPASAPERP
jgi:hypothetical protein